MTRFALSRARRTRVPAPSSALLVGLLLTAGAAHAENSHLNFYPIDAHTGELDIANFALTTVEGPNITRFDRVRVYQHSGQAYLLALDSLAGELWIYELDGSALGARTASYRLGGRFSAMEVGGGSAPWLAVHSATEGFVLRYTLNAGGTLGAMTQLAASEWRDKHVFDIYRSGSNWYYFGYDTFTGDGQVRRHTGEAVSSFDDWSWGWRSVDHLMAAATHRVLYKFADHPGLDGGHLKIDRIAGDGSIISTSFDATVPRGYTTVRFVTTTVPTLGGPAPRYFLFLHDASTGAWEMRPFDGTTLSPVSSSGSVIGSALDMETYQDGGQAYVVLIRRANGPVLMSAVEVDNFVNSLFNRVDSVVPGYSSGLNQYGRTLVQLHDGLVNIADGTPMTVDSFVNVGSVGKLFTTVTILLLVEAGELDLDNPIIDYLPFATDGDEEYVLASVHPSMRFVTVRDLLTYSAGLGVGCDVRADETLDCTPAMESARQASLCQANPAIAGDLDCDYDYQNSAYSLLRDVVEKFTGQHSVAEMVAFTRDLWMAGAGMPNATCTDPPGNAAYYDDKPACSDPWVGHELGTTPSCAAGGWYLPGREMMRFMEAARNELILRPELSRYFLDDALETAQGSETAVGWGRPGGSATMCKSGGLDKDDWGGMSARACLFEEGVDAYLAINTPKTCSDQTGARTNLHGAWDDR